MKRLFALLPIVTACMAPESELTFDDFLADTGYFGSRAAELEATLTSQVRVAMPGRSATELAELAAAVKSSPESVPFNVASQITEQVTYARNKLKADKLNLNLEGGRPEYTGATVVDGGLLVDYSVRIESLVKYKDLEAKNIKIDDLIGNVSSLKLPLQPEGLFERIGDKCATDPDTGAVPAAGDVAIHNLFFYWNPEREGCPLGEADVAAAKFVIESSNTIGNVYPEYDKLVADKKITMVQIYGQITHGELQPTDWGFLSFRIITSAMRELGFTVVKEFDGDIGHKLSKKYPNGLVVEIDMYNPRPFADNVPPDQAREAFRQAMRSHEVVYYAGHAFYGSLDVLDSPDAYPASTYQVIFMDACWSYAYYTKQVFRHKATAADPDGWLLADVINNTEPGITGSETTAMAMFATFFKGADAAYGKKSTKKYSWNNLIKYMNEHAEERATYRGTNDPEIYGVSGVRTNEFSPTR